MCLLRQRPKLLSLPYIVTHTHPHTQSHSHPPHLFVCVFISTCLHRFRSFISFFPFPGSYCCTHSSTHFHTHTHTLTLTCVCVCVYMCLCPSPSPPLLISATTSWHLDGWVCVGPPLLSTLSHQCHFPPLLFCCVARCCCCRSLFFRYSFPAATLSDSSRCLRVSCFHDDG